jgi:sirohydrochlorin cobaltochelatase
MDALILFSHGSVLCGAGEALEAHAERLRARGGYGHVGFGYLNYSEPPFAEAVERAIAVGATRIVVAPYLLVPGFFVRKCREMVEAARVAHPGVAFSFADALGFDARLGDALLESALAARGPEHWRDPLKRAADHCRPNPECPLYGTPACPKVPVAPADTAAKEPAHA